MTLQNNFFRLVTLLSATCFTPCWAENHSRLEEQLTLHLGNRFSTPVEASSNTTTALEIEAAPYFSIGYALEEAQWRIEIELNHTQADLNYINTPNTQSPFNSTQLFYNVFWLPAYNAKLSGLIGAGVGYGHHKISHLSVDTTQHTLSDGQWVAKWMLGAEYQVCRSTKLQVSYEKGYGGDIENKNKTLRVDFPQQDALQLGAVYTF